MNIPPQHDLNGQPGHGNGPSGAMIAQHGDGLLGCQTQLLLNDSINGCVKQTEPGGFSYRCFGPFIGLQLSVLALALIFPQIALVAVR